MSATMNDSGLNSFSFVCVFVCTLFKIVFVQPVFLVIVAGVERRSAACCVFLTVSAVFWRQHSLRG